MKRLMLTIVITLLIATPALAWQEGPGTDWWYIDASYGGYHNSVPLVIQIDGNPGDGQIFAVGETTTITCHLHSYAAACTGWNNGAYLEWALAVGGDSDDGWLWDDNSSGCAELEKDATLSIAPALSSGVYTVSMNSHASVAGWDAAGNACMYNEENAADTLIFQVLEPDPEAGFVTGGGWIDSPAGAYKSDETLEGKASFGFVSKYKKGATVPTGQTEFMFRTADLNFHSDSYDWLVVTGSNYAKFKGTGTINGSGEYKFMLWAGDNTPDTFRIKIWEENGSEVVIYDNGYNGTDQAIDGGSIVIHTN